MSYQPARRRFLCRVSARMAVPALGERLFAGETPDVNNPRATDGDERHEPD